MIPLRPLVASPAPPAGAPAARPARGAEEPPEHGSRAAAGPAPLALDFTQVYRRHFHDVCRWLRAMGCRESDLEDVAQDVFLVVRRKLAWCDGENLPGWLYRVTEYAASDHRRRAWFRRVLLRRQPDEEAPPAQAATGGPLDEIEARRLLERALARMSVPLRTTFVLFEIEGYSGEDIALLQRVPPATVRTRLWNARRALRRALEAIDAEELTAQRHQRGER